MVTLGELKSKFDDISTNSFHFLALINACYAGGVFSVAVPGGNIDDTHSRSAYAMTASSDSDLAWSFGGPADGSVFFDALLEGLRSGSADPLSFTMVDETGEKVVRGGIIRLGALNSYMVARFESWRNGGIELPGDNVLSLPWLGSIAPPTTISRGGFFFVSAPQVAPKFASRYAALSASAKSFAIPTRAASSVPGSPELKIFLEPAAYEIHGIDVSHHNGRIDWNKVAQSGISFAYMKATEGGSFVDKRFKFNWSESGRVGIRRGAYHYLNLCRSADSQFRHIVANVPKTPGMLPIALDVEPNAVGVVPPGGSPTERWRKKFGFRFDKPKYTVNNIEDARASLLELGNRLEKHYGTTPVIFGISESCRLFIDSRFSKFNVWLSQHKEGTLNDVELPGKVPWTIWQYTPKGKLEGVTGAVDRNVFFGSKEAFHEFATQKGNVALRNSGITE